MMNNQSSSNISRLDHLSDMDIILMLNGKKTALLAPAIAFALILMIIGLSGNPVAIYIYGWRWQKTTTRNFLLCLAVIDLVNCLITMPTEVAVMSKFYYFDNAHVCRMSRFVTYVMNNGTSVILLAVAVDRYIRICKPHRQPISPQGALIICGIAVVVGFGVSWPALVLYGREEVALPVGGGRLVRGVMCLVENEYVHTPYPYAFFIYFWVSFSLIAIILTTLYVFIGKVILKRKQMKHDRQMSTEAVMKKYRNASASAENEVFLPQTPNLPTRSEAIHNKDGLNKNVNGSMGSPTPPMSPELGLGSPLSTASPHSGKKFTFPRGKTLASTVWSKTKLRGGRSTAMLFAITVLYILSFLPFLIVVTIRTTIGEMFYQRLSRSEEVVVNIFVRSYLINNSANPIVYGLFNSQFRKELKKLFKCTKKTEDGLTRGGSNRPGGSSLHEKSEH